MTTARRMKESLLVGVRLCVQNNDMTKTETVTKIKIEASSILNKSVSTAEQ